MIALRRGARELADTATLAVFKVSNKRTETSVRRCVVTGVPLSGVIAFWIVRETTPPTLMAKTFAEGCASPETRFFSLDRVMPNECRRQHARLRAA